MDVQKTREARSKAVVIFTKFCQSKEFHENALFCFYEGEDAKYYGSRVEQITGRSCKNIVSYNCGGKAGVLKVKELIKKKKQYEQVKTAYFIDSDFFPEKNLDKDIYQTSGYSVENYYTSTTAFTRILNYAFGISCNSSDFEKCMRDYERSMKVFHKHVLILNAWIKAHRMKELDIGKRRLELSNFKISKCFQTISIEKVCIKQVINKEYLEKCFPDLCMIDDTEISRYVKELKKTNLQQTLRGKYEIEFLRKIIDDLKIKNKNGGYFTEQKECIKIDPNVDPLLLLGQCADTPENLVTYLKQFSTQNVA